MNFDKFKQYVTKLFTSFNINCDFYIDFYNLFIYNSGITRVIVDARLIMY